ncbi:MAG: HEAT repeat domain-containing protein [Myxococcota bacterium]
MIVVAVALASTLGACSTKGGKTGDVVSREGEVTQDWKATAEVQSEEAAADDPALAAAVTALEPIRTRKGTLRFVGDSVRNPEAAPVLLARLAAGVDDPRMRAALVEALPRTGGDYGPAVAAMLTEETDADVRVVMVAALQRADAVSAHDGLVNALRDEDPAVRAEAARVASMREDGSALAGELQTALGDETPQVRAAVARTIGVLSLTDARDGLLPGLRDADAEVRLQSLRAVGRIDPSFAQGLADMTALRADTDARVAAAANRLATR